jgi:hypothetical protein
MRKSYAWPKKYLPDNLSKINNSFQDNFLKTFKNYLQVIARSRATWSRKTGLHFVRNDNIGIFQRSFLNQHNFIKGNIFYQIWLKGV